MVKNKPPEPKPRFLERMKEIFENQEDYEKYLEAIKSPTKKSIRVNELKISPENLVKKIKEKNWKIEQPWKEYPETILIKENLEPGILGKTFEHLLGYYHVQSLSSMMPVIALNPQENQTILDMCASPGSKTTQINSKMKNTGLVFANDVMLGRLKILSSNLEKSGATNTIVTKKDGVQLCKNLRKENIYFDKILIDAPCSGEGTIMNNPKTSIIWNEKTIKKISGLQKNLLREAINSLNPEGEIVYSTCTHAPEENEEVIDKILEEFPEMKIQEINLPMKTRKGMIKWREKEYNESLKLSHRIYPQDNNTEGFFIAKLKKE